MESIKMLGREIPMSVPKDERLSVNNQREAMKKKMIDTVIHDANAVQRFIEWIDTITVDMTQEEVFGALEEKVQQALKGVPPFFVDDVRWVEERNRRKNNQYHELRANSDDENAFIVELTKREEEDRENEDRYEAIVNREHFFFVREVLIWKDAMKEAWSEVRPLQGNPERVLAYVNGMLAERREKPLQKNEIVETIFEPLCVQLVLVPDAFLRLRGAQDAGGLFFQNTHIGLIKHHEKLSEKKQERVQRHESGHHLIDKVHSWGNQEVFRSLNDSWQRFLDFKYMDAPESILEHERMLIIKKAKFFALDTFHNEFCAELNAVRGYDASKLKSWHWGTAEKRAGEFQEKIALLIKKMRREEPEFAKTMMETAVNMVKRFERQKQSVVRGLAIASLLPDPGARDFVVATAFVLPVRSYHHIIDILKYKYPEQEKRIDDEVWREEFKEIMHKDQTKEDLLLKAIFSSKKKKTVQKENTFDRLHRLMMHTKEPKNIDWNEEFSVGGTVLLQEWNITSLEDLRTILVRMRQWPSWEETVYSTPMEEICVAFFNDIVDELWREGKMKKKISPQEIAQDSDMRTGFLHALQISFYGDFYAMDLSEYLRLDNRPPSRDEVLRSPMAKFCKKMGAEKEFLAMVDEKLPA